MLTSSSSVASSGSLPQHHSNEWRIKIKHHQHTPTHTATSTAHDSSDLQSIIVVSSQQQEQHQAALLDALQMIDRIYNGYLNQSQKTKVFTFIKEAIQSQYNITTDELHDLWVVANKCQACKLLYKCKCFKGQSN